MSASRTLVAFVGLLSILFLLAPHVAAAPSAGDGSPQAYRYETFAPDGSGPAYTLLPGNTQVPGSCVLGTLDCLQAGGLRDDEVSACLPLAAPIAFYGVMRTCVYVGANGFVSFTPPGGLGSAASAALPRAPATDMLAAFWTDLVPGACGGGVYQAGTAAGITAIEWRSVVVKPARGPVVCGSATPLTFQLRFDTGGSPGNDQFLVQAQAAGFSLQPTQRSAVTGIQGGTFGLTSFAGPAASPPTNITRFWANHAPRLFDLATTAPAREDAPVGLSWWGYDADVAVHGDAYWGEVVGLTLTASVGSVSLPVRTAPCCSDILNGVATYQPPADYNGPVTVTLTAADPFVSTSLSYTFTVGAVNDAPTLTMPAALTQHRAAKEHVVPGFATGIAPGPATATDETGQTLHITTTTDAPELFSQPPQLGLDGTLTFTPAKTKGTATVTVTLQDDGGTANGGVDTTVATFTLTLD